MWSGAEYRGRGREVNWRGKASMLGNRIERAEAVNFLNPDKPLSLDRDSGIVSWNSVTTGNLAGFDPWLDAGRAGLAPFDTIFVSSQRDLPPPGYCPSLFPRRHPPRPPPAPPSP